MPKNIYFTGTYAPLGYSLEQKTYSFISLLVNFNMSKIVSFLRRLTVFEHFQNPHTGEEPKKNPSPKKEGRRFTKPSACSGEYRNRTDDPLLAGQVL